MTVWELVKEEGYLELCAMPVLANNGSISEFFYSRKYNINSLIMVFKVIKSRWLQK